MEIFDEIHVMEQPVVGMKVSVIGAARSGVAVARLLSTEGAQVFVSDRSPAEKLRSQLADLHALGVEVEAGSHSDRVFDVDMIVLSPGVPSNSPVVQQAKRRGIRIVSELEVASWFCTAPIVASSSFA